MLKYHIPEDREEPKADNNEGIAADLKVID
jgi:hypothetical protein